MSDLKCDDCGRALGSYEFSRPLTAEESQQHFGRPGPVLPPLCKPCWKKAYKARFGEEPTP